MGIVARVVELDGESLFLEDLSSISRGEASAVLAPRAATRVDAARVVIDRAVAENRVVYGVTTGFGKFADVVIPREKLGQLQLNLVRSHAAGTGRPLAAASVRAVMLLRANCLAKGFSGVRKETLELLLACLDKGIHPVIPEQGSVGASGDLAPLAHLALALIGEGEVEWKGKLLPSAEALRAAGLSGAVLEAKEGLALINGPQLTTGLGALALHRLVRLLKAADLVAALTLDTLKGTDAAFDPVFTRRARIRARSSRRAT